MSSENERISNVLFSDTVIHYIKKLLFKLITVPGSYRCLCSETNQLIWTRKQIFKIYNFRGSGNLPFSMVGDFLAGELISSLLITLKQLETRWKLPLLSQTDHGSIYRHLCRMRLDCRVRTSRRIGRIFDSGRGVLLSASPWRVSSTPLSPANWTSQAWSCTTSTISSSTSVKWSVAWRNSPLHELLRVS